MTTSTWKNLLLQCYKPNIARVRNSTRGYRHKGTARAARKRHVL